MLAMPSQIEMYQDMSTLSARMVEAARANDWETLIGLEGDVSRLRNNLMATPEDGNAPATDVAQKRGLIQRILDDDAEIRRHTEPWMEQVRKYLGDSTRRRDMQKAYAAGAGESAPGGFGA